MQGFDGPCQTHTVLSLLQLARRVPVHEYATLLHSVSCPSKVLIHSHSPPACSPSSSRSCSHIPIFASKEAVARVSPDGAHATARTVLLCPVDILAVFVNFISRVEGSLLYE